METTNQLDFSIKTEKEVLSTESYVVLKAGKGKKANSSIYLNAIEFSYLEGLIWAKYREYNSGDKHSITASDWTRILTSFKIGIDDLSNDENGENIKSVLSFDLFNPRYPLDNIPGYAKEIKLLLEDISEWVSVWIEKEKKITILKNQ